MDKTPFNREHTTPLIDELVVIGLILISLYSGYYFYELKQEYTALHSEKIEVNSTKEELAVKVQELEKVNKQKQTEIDNLKAELKDLSYLKRLQKDIARLFDGSKNWSYDIML